MKNINLQNNQLEIPIIGVCKSALFTSFPVVLILFGVYYFIRGGYDVLHKPWRIYFEVMGIYIVLFILHELIHGAAYYLYNGHDHKNIKFGTDEEYLKPYCKCLNFIDISVFKTVRIMPFILCGILPYLIAIITGNFILMISSLLSILSCGVDLVTIYLLTKHKEIKQIKDIHNSYGFMRYEIKY